tara:strand:- start:27580 stop:28611 length:1032 start_codon:yes stop_codon:yes gene_type:complete
MLLSKIIDLLKKGRSNYLDSNIFKEIDIENAASLEVAKENEITFLEENNILKDSISTTLAGVIIVSDNPEIIRLTKDKSISTIVVRNPRIAFAEILDLLYKKNIYEARIDKSANINSESTIGKNCFIGANVFIGKETKIGDNNQIFPGAVILDNVAIGNNNIIYPNCVIHENTIIKDNCVINSNAVIGSEGFGFIPESGKWIKMPQKGGVILNNSVEIGTNSCIDRPSVGHTIIGEGTKIDNLVQIGHGVKIGKNCAFAAQVGIAGGAIIGNNVILAGQVGVNNRVKVGNNVIASSKCGIHCDIKNGEIISGFPAMPNKSWLRSSTVFKKLPELAKKLRNMDK